jgi:hypothetical protein
VFVGHNFAAFHLDVLLHRLQHHKVHVAQSARNCTCCGVVCVAFGTLFVSARFAQLFAMLVAVPCHAHQDAGCA